MDELPCENSKFSKLLFDGGYFDVSYGRRHCIIPPHRSPDMTDEEYQALIDSWHEKMRFNGMHMGFKFYNRDHLGSVREVVSASGEVEQTNDYYPFGTPIYRADGNTNSQKYKFNGKEFDEMHGLSSLDYGARQYYPVLPLWDRVDPLCEKYYSISPYAYCLGNPVNYVDPNGREPIYDVNGNYLGCTSEGFTGMIYVYTGIDANTINWNDQSIRYYLDPQNGFNIGVTMGGLMAYDSYEQLISSYTELHKSFVTNVMTNIAEHYEGMEVFNDKIFSMKDINGGRIQYTPDERSNFITRTKGNEITIMTNGMTGESYEGTVENFAATIILHEWFSHGKYKVGDKYKNHRIAYKNVMNDKLIYPKTTIQYKSFVRKLYNIYCKKELNR